MKKMNALDFNNHGDPMRNHKTLPNLKNWQTESEKAMGHKAGAAFLIRVQSKYNELFGQARQYENKALQQHFDNNIMPAMAAYSVLLDDGKDKESALQVIDRLLEATIDSARTMYRFWGRFPFFFDMIRIMLKPMMKKNYPERWNIEWLDLGHDVTGMNCRACFYLDTLTDYGFAELTPHFCRLDELLAAEATPSIRFERTQTLARGGTMCDFRYVRVKR